MYRDLPILRRYFVFVQVDVHLRGIEKLKPNEKRDADVNNFFVERLKRGSVQGYPYLDVCHPLETTGAKFVEPLPVALFELEWNPHGITIRLGFLHSNK